MPSETKTYLPIQQTRTEVLNAGYSHGQSDSETLYDFRSVTSETHTGSLPEETEDDEIFCPPQIVHLWDLLFSLGMSCQT